jgi:hypothetical protein
VYVEEKVKMNCEVSTARTLHSGNGTEGGRENTNMSTLDT